MRQFITSEKVFSEAYLQMRVSIKSYKVLKEINKTAIKRRVQENRPVGMDLNESNVHGLFQECISRKMGDENLIHVILFDEDRGFDEDSKPMFFVSEKIEKSRCNIRSLFGQLQVVHENEKRFTLESVSKKYTGENWTTDKRILLEFLHLGAAAGIFFPFSKEGDDVSAPTAGIFITFSPLDSRANQKGDNIAQDR